MATLRGGSVLERSSRVWQRTIRVVIFKVSQMHCENCETKGEK